MLLFILFNSSKRKRVTEISIFGLILPMFFCGYVLDSLNVDSEKYRAVVKYVAVVLDFFDSKNAKDICFLEEEATKFLYLKDDNVLFIRIEDNKYLGSIKIKKCLVN